MLMRSEPFTEVNRLAQQLFGTPVTGTWSHPATMPCDAYRDGDAFVIAFDLPGVDAEAIDIGVERNVLTVKAERRPLDLGEEATAHLSERAPGRVLPAVVPR
jgi:HSP20 family protein